MNVILDIDETIVHYVGNSDWERVPENERAKYQTAGISSAGLFILRPHFDTLFAYLFENCKSVNLWTWSDKEYAEEVARIIQSHNPKWKPNNIWYDDDAEASREIHGHNKDLNYIWYTKKVFQPCDTILVDDLPENTQNPSNRKNGIQIRPFNPLGEKRKKEDRKQGRLREGVYTDLSSDDTLLRVVDVIKKANDNPEKCEEGDMPPPFSSPVILAGGRRRRTMRGCRRGSQTAAAVRRSSRHIRCRSRKGKGNNRR